MRKSLAIIAASLLAMSAASYALAYPRLAPDSVQPRDVIKVVQPTLGRPVQLHGVVNQVDPAHHKIYIVQLSGLEYFWQPTARNCPVDPNLALPVMAQGTKVRFTLSRGVANQYYVSAIETY